MNKLHNSMNKDKNVIKVTTDKYGYDKEYVNKNAKIDNTVYIVQTGKYDGFTAVIDNPKNPNKPKIIGHGISAEKLGMKFAKKYKRIEFRD